MPCHIGEYRCLCSQQSGMLALTRAVAIEFARYNIRCNAILPGR